jgi:predicted nucleic acid-binding protein
MIVVADTSSLNYLVLIRHIEVLPKLYGRILIPRAVYNELSAEKAPPTVREWTESRPNWLMVHDVVNEDASMAYLGNGEQEGIVLAQTMHADLIVLDDLDARRAAAARNITVMGTLGVLTKAAEQGLINLEDALGKLQATNFRASISLIARLLQQNRK